MEYAVRIMTLDGIEEETQDYTNATDAWNAYDEAASWGMGWYRALAEGVTA